MISVKDESDVIETVTDLIEVGRKKSVFEGLADFWDKYEERVGGIVKLADADGGAASETAVMVRRIMETAEQLVRDTLT